MTDLPSKHEVRVTWMRPTTYGPHPHHQKYRPTLYLTLAPLFLITSSFDEHVGYRTTTSVITPSHHFVLFVYLGYHTTTSVITP